MSKFNLASYKSNGNELSLSSNKNTANKNFSVR